MPPLLPGKKRTGTKANLFQAHYFVDGNTNWLHFMHLKVLPLTLRILFKFPFLQSFLLHYPKYLSYSRLTNIQDQITLFYFIEKCLTWIIIFSTILQQMEKNHKLCHLNVDQMYLLHAILIKRNVWQSLERIDLLELKVSLLLLFFPP